MRPPAALPERWSPTWWSAALPLGPIWIAQGEEMGRPGEILVEVSRDSEGATEVRVSGRVQVWAEGRLTGLPEV